MGRGFPFGVMRMVWSSIDLVVAPRCEGAKCCLLFPLKWFIPCFVNFISIKKVAIENYFWMIFKKSWGRGAGFAHQTWSGGWTGHGSDPGFPHLPSPRCRVALTAQNGPARVRTGACRGGKWGGGFSVEESTLNDLFKEHVMISNVSSF